MRNLVYSMLALSVVAMSLSIYLIQDLSHGQRGRAYIGVHVVLSALMLLAWWLGQKPSRFALGSMIIGGMVARMVLVGASPFTTHDVQRYLWDGHALVKGYDPYVFTPEQLVSESAMEGWEVAPEHAAYSTLYPPVALGLFALCAQWQPETALKLWKGLTSLASLLLLFLAWLVLRRVGQERHFSLIAYSPLLILEAGVGAHLDVFSALAVTAAVWCGLAGRYGCGGACLGVGTLLKLAPALCVPIWMAALGCRHRVQVLGGWIAVMLSGYVVPLLADLKPIGSLVVFAQTWRFGSPGLWLLDRVGIGAGLVGGALCGGAGFVVVLLYTRRLGCWRAMLMGLGWLFFWSPVVFPWYLMVLVPLVAMSPMASVVAWLLVAPLTYEVIDLFERTGIWDPALWPQVVCCAAIGLGSLMDGRSQAIGVEGGR